MKHESLKCLWKKLKDKPPTHINIRMNRETDTQTHRRTDTNRQTDTHTHTHTVPTEFYYYTQFDNVKMTYGLMCDYFTQQSSANERSSESHYNSDFSSTPKITDWQIIYDLHLEQFMP